MCSWCVWASSLYYCERKKNRKTLLNRACICSTGALRRWRIQDSNRDFSSHDVNNVKMLHTSMSFSFNTFISEGEKVWSGLHSLKYVQHMPFMLLPPYQKGYRPPYLKGFTDLSKFKCIYTPNAAGACLLWLKTEEIWFQKKIHTTAKESSYYESFLERTALSHSFKLVLRPFLHRL
jgi:hypothetical protein